MLSDSIGGPGLQPHHARHEQRERQQAERAATQQAAAARQKRYNDMLDKARAIAAADGPFGSRWPSLFELSARALIREAMIEPAYEIHWLRRGSLSGTLVTSENAICFYGQRLITTWPLTSIESITTGFHETGHARDNRQRSTTIERELFAWGWAHGHMPFWTDECERHLRSCLGGYLLQAQRAHVPDLVKAERFLAQRRPLRSADEAVATFEAREWQRRNGLHECQGIGCSVRRDRPLAVAFAGSQRVCAGCLEHSRIDQQLSDMRKAVGP